MNEGGRSRDGERKCREKEGMWSCGSAQVIKSFAIARGKCSERGKAGGDIQVVWKFCRQEGDGVKYQQLESLICHSAV